ncbi:hypothetical protein FNF28_02123 [Cafeteria roenbergensis]|uniref:Uncharacterized protein n=1 Tax=Cafeteria roenbergensis TaxID=33653 RepID=A0A5A8DV43_CAFRO|nr:hypothetical protein FNF28_02123 [Cafeteria roenbergensis]
MGCPVRLRFDGEVTADGTIRAGEIAVTGAQVSLGSSSFLDASGLGLRKNGSAISTGRGGIGIGKCGGSVPGGGGAFGGSGSDGWFGTPPSGCEQADFLVGRGGYAHGDSVFADGLAAGSPGGDALLVFKNPGDAVWSTVTAVSGALGGGTIEVVASAGNVSMHTGARIFANGENGKFLASVTVASGAGSGGAIAVRAPQGSIIGGSTLQAHGGGSESSSGGYGGAGGGGRILLQTRNSVAASEPHAVAGCLDNAVRASAFGGQYYSREAASAGTIAHVAGGEFVSLRVDNNNVLTALATVLPPTDAPVGFQSIGANGTTPLEFPGADVESAVRQAARPWRSITVTGKARVTPAIAARAVVLETTRQAQALGLAVPLDATAIDGLLVPEPLERKPLSESAYNSSDLFRLDPPTASESVPAGYWGEIVADPNAQLWTADLWDRAERGMSAPGMGGQAPGLLRFAPAFSALVVGSLRIDAGASISGADRLDVVTLQADIRGELLAGQQLRLQDGFDGDSLSVPLPKEWEGAAAACAAEGNAAALSSFSVLEEETAMQDNEAVLAARGNTASDLRSSNISRGFLTAYTASPVLALKFGQVATLTGLVAASLDSGALGGGGDLHDIRIDVRRNEFGRWEQVDLAASMLPTASPQGPSMIQFQRPEQASAIRLRIASTRHLGAGMIRLVCDGSRGIHLRGASARIACLADGCAVSTDLSKNGLPLVAQEGGGIVAPAVSVRAPAVFLQDAVAAQAGHISGNGQGLRASSGPGAGRSAVSRSGDCPLVSLAGTGASHGGTGGRSCSAKPACNRLPTAWRNVRGTSGADLSAEAFDGAFDVTYGTVAAPSMLGSGGGAGIVGGVPTSRGGRGGGVVRVEVATVTATVADASTAAAVGGSLFIATTGRIVADGEASPDGSGGGGSGGSVVAVADRMIGKGIISAHGGGYASPGQVGGAGGGGRIHVAVSQELVNSIAAGWAPSVAAYGSTAAPCGGGAGTVLLTVGQSHTLVIDAGAAQDSALQAVTPVGETYLTSSLQLGQLDVTRGAMVAASSANTSDAALPVGGLLVEPLGKVVGRKVNIRAQEILLDQSATVEARAGVRLVASDEEMLAGSGKPRSFRQCAQNQGADPTTGRLFDIPWKWAETDVTMSLDGFNGGAWVDPESLRDGDNMTGFRAAYSQYPIIQFDRPTWINGLEVQGPGFLPEASESEGWYWYINFRKSAGDAFQHVDASSAGIDDRNSRHFLRQVRFARPVLAVELQLVRGAHFALSELRPFCAPGGVTIKSDATEASVSVSCSSRRCPVEITAQGRLGQQQAHGSGLHMVVEASLKGGNVSVTSSSDIEFYGHIDTSALGHEPGEGPGAPAPSQLADLLRVASGAGGAYGGHGGSNRYMEGLGPKLPAKPPVSTGGQANGLALKPHEQFGSGGGDPVHLLPEASAAWAGTAGSGGGIIAVRSLSTLKLGTGVTSSFRAEGGAPAALTGSIRGGCGSGGGILVSAAVLLGAVEISADSQAAYPPTGGGSGGRILVQSQHPRVPKSIQAHAYGGQGYGFSGVDDRVGSGAAGTVVVEANSSRTLIVADKLAPARDTGLKLSVPGVFTPLPDDFVANSGAFDESPNRLHRVIVTEKALLQLPDNATLRAESLQVDQSSRVNGSAFTIDMRRADIHGFVTATRGLSWTDRSFRGKSGLAGSPGTHAVWHRDDIESRGSEAHALACDPRFTNEQGRVSGWRAVSSPREKDVYTSDGLLADADAHTPAAVTEAVYYGFLHLELHPLESVPLQDVFVLTHTGHEAKFSGAHLFAASSPIAGRLDPSDAYNERLSGSRQNWQSVPNHANWSRVSNTAYAGQSRNTMIRFQPRGAAANAFRVSLASYHPVAYSTWTSDPALWLPHYDVSLIEPLPDAFLDFAILDNVVVHATPGTAVSAGHLHVGPAAMVVGDESMKQKAAGARAIIHGAVSGSRMELSVTEALSIGAVAVDASGRGYADSAGPGTPAVVEPPGECLERLGGAGASHGGQGGVSVQRSTSASCAADDPKYALPFSAGEPYGLAWTPDAFGSGGGMAWEFDCPSPLPLGSGVLSRCDTPDDLDLVSVDAFGRLWVQDGRRLKADQVRVGPTAYILGNSFMVDSLRVQLRKGAGVKGSHIRASKSLVITDESFANSLEPEAMIWRFGKGHSRVNPGWAHSPLGSGRIDGDAPKCSSASELMNPAEVKSVHGAYLDYAGHNCATSDVEARQFLLDDNDETGVCVNPVTGHLGGIVLVYDRPVTFSQVRLRLQKPKTTEARVYQSLRLSTMNNVTASLQDPDWKQVSGEMTEEAPTPAADGLYAPASDVIYFTMRHPVAATHVLIEHNTGYALLLGRVEPQCTSTGLSMIPSSSGTTETAPAISCEERGCSLAISLTHPASIVHAFGEISGSSVTLRAPHVRVGHDIHADQAGYAAGAGPGSPGRSIWTPHDPKYSGRTCPELSVVAGAGGSHGGHGGPSCATSQPCAPSSVAGVSYGLATSPWEFGSGGQTVFVNGQEAVGYAGAGGGRVSIEATAGDIYFEQSLSKPNAATPPRVSADGQPGVYFSAQSHGGGGGAGGSVSLTARAVRGLGVVATRGGAYASASGSGGGGRVAVRASQGVEPRVSLEVQGGSASAACSGASGTLYVVTEALGERLMVKNSVPVAAVTPWPEDAPSTLNLAWVGDNSRVALTDEQILMGRRIRVHHTASVEPLRSFNGTLPSLQARKITLRGRQIDLYGAVEATGPGSSVSVGSDVLFMHRNGKVASTGHVEILGRDEVAERNDSPISLQAAPAEQGGSAWVHEAVCSAQDTVKVHRFRGYRDPEKALLSVSELSALTDGDLQTFVSFNQAFDLYFVDSQGSRVATNVNALTGVVGAHPHDLVYSYVYGLRGNGEGAEREVDAGAVFANFEDEEVITQFGQEWSFDQRTGFDAGQKLMGERGRFRIHFQQPLVNITGIRVVSSHYTYTPKLYELGFECDERFVGMTAPTSVDCETERCLVEFKTRRSVIASRGRVRGGDVDVSAQEVVIGHGGIVDSTGLGHPADSGPGTPLQPSRNIGKKVCRGTASGSGAGHGGRGGPHNVLLSGCGDVVTPAAHPRIHGGLSYGDAELPREFGSGGGSGYSWAQPEQASGLGGSGGGRIRMGTSGAILLAGQVSADGLPGVYFAPKAGEYGAGGGGSGGSILLSSGAGVALPGTAFARGGGYPYHAGAGSGGRIAILADRGLVELENDARHAATGAVSDVDSFGAPGTVIVSDLNRRELHIRNDARRAWAAEVETPWPLQLARPLSLARVKLATVRVGLHPSEALRVGDSVPPADEASSQSAIWQAQSISMEQGAWALATALDVRALAVQTDLSSILRGESSLRVRDAAFAAQAQQLSMAGRCLAGGLRGRFTVTDHLGAARPRATLQDGDMTTYFTDHTLVFAFPTPVPLSSLRMKSASPGSAYYSIQISALRQGGDPLVAEDWNDVFVSAIAETPTSHGSRWRRWVWPLVEATHWRLLAIRGYSLYAAEAEWGCEGDHFLFDGLLECTGELCEVETRGTSALHLTAVRGVVRGATVSIVDQHTRLDMLPGVTPTTGGSKWVEFGNGAVIDASGADSASFVSGRGLGVESGAGAGGSVQLRGGSIVGVGSVRAKGGSGPAKYGAGAGGGGRIAVFAANGLDEGVELSASGGFQALGTRHGAAGTVYLELAGRTEMVVDAKEVTPSRVGYSPVPHTQWPPDLADTVDLVRIRNGALVSIAEDTTERARRVELDPTSVLEGGSFELAVASALLRGTVQASASLKVSDNGFEEAAFAETLSLGGGAASICGASGPLLRQTLPPLWMASQGDGASAHRQSSDALSDADPRTGVNVAGNTWIEFDFGRPVSLSFARILSTSNYVQFFASNSSMNASAAADFKYPYTGTGPFPMGPASVEASDFSPTEVVLVRFQRVTTARFWQVYFAHYTTFLSSLSFGCGSSGLPGMGRQPIHSPSVGQVSRE